MWIEDKIASFAAPWPSLTSAGPSPLQLWWIFAVPRGGAAKALIEDRWNAADLTRPSVASDRDNERETASPPVLAPSGAGSAPISYAPFKVLVPIGAS